MTTLNDKLALIIGHAIINQQLAQENLATVQAENADLKARLAEYENGVPEPTEQATA